MAPTTEKDCPMCMPVTCNTCKKVTWEGCGQHAEQVLAPYPPEQRCTCE